MNPRKDALLGLLVAAALISVVTTLLVFTDAGMFRGRYQVVVTVEDAGGLRRGDPVQMRGVNVGRVRSFDFTADGVRVQAEINGEYRPPEDSQVVLRSNGLLGGMIVDILPGQSPRPLARGAEVPGTSEAPLTRTATEVGGSAADALRRVEALLADPTIPSLRRGVASLETLIVTLADLANREAGTVEAVGDDLRGFASNLRVATDGADLPAMLAGTDTLLTRIGRGAVSVEGAAVSLDRVLERVANADGTVGLLTEDPRLYEELVRAVVSFTRLADDIRENPRRYVTVRVF